jgi:hypothetical protein
VVNVVYIQISTTRIKYAVQVSFEGALSFPIMPSQAVGAVNPLCVGLT